MIRLVSVTLVILLAAALPVRAQAPAAAPAPAQAAPARDLPTPPADFTYGSGGRRDPFAPLTRGVLPISATGGSRPAGVAGLGAEELVVRGILLSDGAFVAMISGPAKGQNFTVKAGAKLFDGTVQSINAQEVVILQQLNDPLAVQKQREVRKALRSQEEGK
ncbi:MAG: hypothetical protein AB7O28_17435 [Vicinamibacterales bacterium]